MYSEHNFCTFKVTVWASSIVAGLSWMTGVSSLQHIRCLILWIILARPHTESMVTITATRIEQGVETLRTKANCLKIHSWKYGWLNVLN